MIITVYHIDGTHFHLFKSGDVISITKLDQVWTLMDEDVIDIEIESSCTLEFAIGDYITIYNRKYILNQLPEQKKGSTRKFKYTAQFEGIQYQLTRTIVLNVNSGDSAGLENTPNFFVGDFSYTGDAMDFVQLVVYNMGRVTDYDGVAWNIGTTYEGTETKTLDFTGETCLEVLNKICEEYDLEFTIEQTGSNAYINMFASGGAGRSTGITLKYGYTQGICDLTRKNVDDSNVITALFVLGSDKNLASDYRGYSPRLKLPGSDSSMIKNAAKVSLYGYYEGLKIFDDIFPHREGEITSLGTTYEFVDSTMSFDLNETDVNGTLYLIEGVTAKIHFNSGQLAGYEFILSRYTHATKTFKIEKYTDERGQEFPDYDVSVFQFAIGDKYTILDIRMPASYITDAENALNAAGVIEYNKVSQPQVSYDCTMDQIYIKNLFAAATDENYIYPGDKIHIEDTDINVDKDIRIISFTRDLLRPNKYDITLDDIPRKRKIWIDPNKTKKAVKKSNLYLNSYRQRIENTVNNYESTIIYGPQNERFGVDIELVAGLNHVSFDSTLGTTNYILQIIKLKTDEQVDVYTESDPTCQEDGFWITIPAEFSNGAYLTYRATKLPA